MGDINSAVLGLLLLVPVVIGVVVAYGAIKCSEWHIWNAHYLIGRRHKSKSRSHNSTDSTGHHASTDLERASRGEVVDEIV